MAPSNSAPATKKVWFKSPWKLEKEDPTHLVYQPAATLQPGDAECEPARLERSQDTGIHSGSSSNPDDLLEDDLASNNETQLQVLQDDTRNVFVEFINDHEEQMSSACTSSKIIPVVTYDGHAMYKSTLVGQLNGNLYLSKDRLTRIKNSIYFNNADDYDGVASSTTTMFMGLESDVGVYFNNLRTTGGSSTRSDKRGKRGRPSPTNCGVDNGIFCVGRVQKLRVKVGTKWGMCWHPIDLMKRSIQNAG